MAFVPRIVKLLFEVYLRFTAIVHRAAHHPQATRSHSGAAPAARSTCDAATSTHDLDPITIDIAESECELSGTHEAEAAAIPRPVQRGDTAARAERANTTLTRFVDEMYGWIPVAACVALVYVHWRGIPDARLVGLRG